MVNPLPASAEELVVQLAAISTRSPRASILSPQDIARCAARAGHHVAVLADTDALFAGWPALWKGAREAQVAPACGLWLHAAQGPPAPRRWDRAPGDYLALATNEDGLHALMRLSSEACAQPGAARVPTAPEALEDARAHLRFAPATPRASEALHSARIAPHFVFAHRNTPGAPGADEHWLRRYADDHGLPCVGGACWRAGPQTEAHVLACLAAVERRSAWEAEAPYATGLARALPAQALQDAFSDAPELLRNASRLALSLRLDADARTRKRDPGAEAGHNRALERRASEGLEQRLREQPDPERNERRYAERLEEELGLIGELGFAELFLLVAELCEDTRRDGALIGPGRGSAASSLVAWCLRITELDPIANGLWISRFLNASRAHSPPDFDIDVPPRVQAKAQASVRARWSEERSSALTEWKTFGVRDATRAVARAHGLTPKAADAIVDTKRADPRGERIRHTGTALSVACASIARHPCAIALYDDLAAHASATWRAPGAGAAAEYEDIAQIDHLEAESARGAVKVDVLALRTLELLENTRAATGGPHPWRLALDDARTYRTIASARTGGVFQLEGAGIRTWARRLNPSHFNDLRALIALYRPGPMRLLPAYARRAQGQEPPEPVHEALREVLAETHGLIVYQEQAIAAAVHVAGFTEAHADALRRAIGKKRPREMAALQRDFTEGARRHGALDERAATALWGTLQTHAGYSFNKAHSTAYALISYATAWYRTHHPVAFFAALADNAVQRDHPRERLRECIADAAAEGVAFAAPRLGARTVAKHRARHHAPAQGAPTIDSPLHTLAGIGMQSAARLRREAAALPAPRPKNPQQWESALGARGVDSATLATLRHAGALGDPGTGAADPGEEHPWPGKGFDVLPRGQELRVARARGALATLREAAYSTKRNLRCAVAVLEVRDKAVRVADPSHETWLWYDATRDRRAPALEHRANGAPGAAHEHGVRRERKASARTQTRIVRAGATIVATVQGVPAAIIEDARDSDDAPPREARARLLAAATLQGAEQWWPSALAITLPEGETLNEDLATLKALLELYRPGTARVSLCVRAREGGARTNATLPETYALRPSLPPAIAAALPGATTEVMGPLAGEARHAKRR